MSALAKFREAVAATQHPELERGQDTDDDREPDNDADDKPKAKKKGKKGRKARESFRYLIREAEVHRNGGGYEATVLREGPGKGFGRRFYTKQALRQAVADRLMEGLQAYANHPSRSEERDRPERDVRQLVGHFREARYVEEGGRGKVMAKFVPIDGPGYEWVRSLIEAALKAPPGKPLIGISIDGYGECDGQQDIGGQTYDMVREIAHLGSADIVTRAGAGGQFHRRLQESMKLTERDFSRKERKKDAKSGAAMDDGSYPIENQTDANNAWKLRGKGKGHSKAAIVAHIRKRVKALGLKMPGDDKTRESNPAAQAGTSQEGRMKPAELQEKIKGAVAKLREAAKIEDDEARAEALIEEGLTELDECAEVKVERKAKEVIREVEKPVAASDSNEDQLAAELEATKTKLTEAESQVEEERKVRRDAESKLDSYQRANLASKVLREAKVPEKAARSWFEDVVACEGEDAMKALVQRKMDERESIFAEFRESQGVEGVPARIPAITAAPDHSGGLLDRMGIDRAELAA